MMIGSLGPEAIGPVDRLVRGRWLYRIVSALLFALVAAAVYAYAVQLTRGLGVTGLSDRLFWGVYIANFVFFIGISYAGTLMSSVLRLAGQEWRRPITRNRGDDHGLRTLGGRCNGHCRYGTS